MRAIQVTVYGHVQGVFFRAGTREKALALGLAGTVRNLPDGSVFIEAEGEPWAVEQLLAWCRVGPVGAHVTKVNVTETALKGFSEFLILR